MRRSKRTRLERSGWVIGSVKDFLGLSEADAALIEMKLAFSRMLRERRTQYGLSQTNLAKQLQSSQSRVAKMEAGDPSVTMDLLISALLLLRAKSGDLAKAMRGRPERRSRAA
jgi:DNA-binding XRE family transcriptional regulator